MLQTFLFNRAWTFSAIGGKPGAFRRYCASYALGYAVNLLALHVFVDVLGYPHQIVQASALVGVAVLLFVTQRFWVFR